MRWMAEPDTREATVCYRHPRVETAVSCSECGRPICTDCMRFGPVGIRCPECSAHRTVPGSRRRLAAPTTRFRGLSLPAGWVTISLIVANVAVYIAELATGASFSDLGNPVNTVAEKGALNAILVDQGDWWRLITSAFLHVSLIHILFNMVFLWWFGRSLEHVLGPVRYIGVYLVSALAAAAGALIVAPVTSITVGASGAVFGILGAGLVLERRSHILVFGGQALAVIAINLILSFVLSGISIGGHIGGVIGGAAAMLVLGHFGRYRSLLSKEGLIAIACLIGLGALSVIIAYARVRQIG
jgi:membrane associated rhomboid family serine protease